jgi:hypothetical protein
MRRGAGRWSGLWGTSVRPLGVIGRTAVRPIRLIGQLFIRPIPVVGRIVVCPTHAEGRMVVRALGQPPRRDEGNAEIERVTFRREHGAAVLAGRDRDAELVASAPKALERLADCVSAQPCPLSQPIHPLAFPPAARERHPAASRVLAGVVGDHQRHDPLSERPVSRRAVADLAVKPGAHALTASRLPEQSRAGTPPLSPVPGRPGGVHWPGRWLNQLLDGSRAARRGSRRSLWSRALPHFGVGEACGSRQRLVRIRAVRGPR